MLDIKAIRQNPELVASALLKRGMTFDRARFEALDARRKEADVRAQNLLAERKSASKRIGELVASGKSVEKAKAEVDSTLIKLSEELEAATVEAESVQTELNALLIETPNLPDERVPEGSSEDDNEEIFRWGEPRHLDFMPKDHVDLGELTGQMLSLIHI